MHPVLGSIGWRAEQPAASTARRAQTAEECFEEAEIALMQDDLDTARARYTQALKMEPQVRGRVGGDGTRASTGGPHSRHAWIDWVGWLPMLGRHALTPVPANLQNGEYLSGYGAFLAETGNPEEAVQVLTKAAAAQPDTGFEKYM